MSANRIEQSLETVLISAHGITVPCKDVLQFKAALPSLPTISDVAFSSSDPNLLYLVTIAGEVYSLGVTRPYRLTPIMVGSQMVLDDDMLAWSIHCHGGNVYIAESSQAIVYLCEPLGPNHFRILNRSCTSSRYSFSTSLILGIGETTGNVFYRNGYGNGVVVLNRDTLWLRGTLTLPHYTNALISRDGGLHAATESGVHIYDARGTPTGRSYLGGEECLGLTAASGETVFVGMVNHVAAVHETSVVYRVGERSMAHYQVDCKGPNLAMLDTYGVLTVLPWEKLQPPPPPLPMICGPSVASCEGNDA